MQNSKLRWGLVLAACLALWSAKSAVALRSVDDLRKGNATVSKAVTPRAKVPAAVMAERKEAAKKLDLKVTWSGERGSPSFVSGEDILKDGPPSKGVGADVKEKAVAVMDVLAPVYGIRKAESGFDAHRVGKSATGYTHVKLRQKYRGLTVFGGDVVVHFDGKGKARTVNGMYQAVPEMDVKPALTADQAAGKASADLMAMGKPAGRLEKAPELVVYALCDPVVLAWQMTLLVSDGGVVVGRWRYWIDARTGDVVDRFNDVPAVAPTTNGVPVTISGSILDGEGGGVEDVEGWDDDNGLYYLLSYTNRWEVYNSSQYEDLWPDADDHAQRDITDWGTSDRVEMSAAFNVESVQAYYRTVHNRRSYNNASAMLRVNVHYGDEYVNAFWNGVNITFGDGDGETANSLAVMDVLAHEYQHAVTEYTANLIYRRESGALNESFSDIFGTLNEFAVQPDGRAYYPGAMPGMADWLTGEDCWIAATALRDMRNPSNVDTVGPDGVQPSRYKGTHWYTGYGDNGGVHYNCGVQNFFFYLLCEGGSGVNDGITYNVPGIGMAAAEKLAYLTLDGYMVPATEFADAREAWLAAASETDTTGVTTDAVYNVMCAWAAVGVGTVQFVTPDDDYMVRGIPSVSAFLPSNIVYAVTNYSSTSMTWTVTYTKPWLVVEPSNFVVNGKSGVAVTVAVDQAVAEGLPTDRAYIDTVLFTNDLAIGAASRLAILRSGDNCAIRSTPYEWVDPITNMHYGVSMPGGVSQAIPLPFPLVHYDVEYTNVYVSFHGLMGVDPAGLGALTTNTVMPGAGVPNGVIAPMWGESFGSEAVYYTIEGTAPARRLVVTWLNVATSPNLVSKYSYQVILKESFHADFNNDIIFQFKDVEENSATLGSGQQQVIGLESGHGLVAKPYSFLGTSWVADERAMLFTLLPPDDTTLPTGTIRLFSVEGSTVWFEVEFSEIVTWPDPMGSLVLDSTIPGAAVGAIRGGGLRYLVPVENVSGLGRLTLGIATNAVRDLEHNWNASVIGPVLYVAPVRKTDFHDDMELGPGQWAASVQDPVLKTTAGWEWGEPVYIWGPEAYSGDHCLGTVLGGPYTEDMNAWIESKPFQVGANPVLDFEVWFDLEEYYDFGYVEVYNGEGWHNVTRFGATYWSEGAYNGFWYAWRHDTIALDNATFGNRVLKVRFRATSDYSIAYAGMYVDDVLVTSEESPALKVVSYSPDHSAPGVSNVLMEIALYNAMTTTFANVTGRLTCPEAGVTVNGGDAIAYGAMGPGEIRTNTGVSLSLAAGGNFANPTVLLFHQASAGTATFGESMPFLLDGVLSASFTNLLVGKSASGVTNWLGQRLRGDGTAGSCLFQIIAAGSNGVPDAALPSGQVAGDDKLLYSADLLQPWGRFGEGSVPANMGMFVKAFAHSEPSNTPVYARAWDGPTFAASVAYGDSAVFRLSGLAVQTNNFGTWGVGTPSDPARDSNGDSIPDGEAMANGLDPRAPLTGLTNGWYTLKQMGSAGDGSGQFDAYPPSPTRVGCGGNYLYVLDTGHSKIQVWNRFTGAYVGSYGSLGSGNGQFSMPYGLGFHPQTNRFAVADQNNFRIQVFEYDPVTGTNISHVLPFGDSSRFTKVTDVAIAPDGRFYVTQQTDSLETRGVQMFSSSGDWLSVLAWSGTGSGQVISPWGVAVAPDGMVVVADTQQNRLQAWNSSGGWLWAAEASEFGFVGPKDVAFGPGGLLYVADTGNSRLVVLRVNGTGATLVGVAPTASLTTPYTLLQPYSLVAPATTNVAYVADTLHNRVLAVNVIVDGDGDGMDDVWEILHGLNPLDASDAMTGSNANGLVNIGAYRLQQEPGLALRITAFSVNPQILRWQTVATGGIYQIQYSQDSWGIATNSWQGGPVVTSQVIGSMSVTNVMTLTNAVQFIRVLKVGP
jgi:thermolysin